MLRLAEARSGPRLCEAQRLPETRTAELQKPQCAILGPEYREKLNQHETSSTKSHRPPRDDAAWIIWLARCRSLNTETFSLSHSIGITFEGR